VKRFIVSANARADLDGIWDYIAERSSAETASTFLWQFHELFASLAQSPSAGVIVQGLEGPIRKFPMGNYLIYYRASRGRVTIWRVLHGRRIQIQALRGRPSGPGRQRLFGRSTFRNRSHIRPCQADVLRIVRRSLFFG